MSAAGCHCFDLLIADIYQDSYFQVICGKELSSEFSLTIGTKTGDPLSAILFIVTLDRSLKDVHNTAIISLNVHDEQRISPLLFSGYADDIALVSLFETVLKVMLETLIEKHRPVNIVSGQINVPFSMNVGQEMVVQGQRGQTTRNKNTWKKSRGTTPTRAIHISGKAVNCSRRR